MHFPRLEREFFQRPTLEVAQGLLGKTLVYGNVKGCILETEAYIGENDPACHAAHGRTARTAVMYGPPGYSYVYLIYGMYHMLNIVTEAEGFPAAVLIRTLKLYPPVSGCFDGPGKLTRALGITLHHNRVDMVGSPDLYVEDSGMQLENNATPRIGIKVGTEKLWRFVAV